MPAQKAAMRVIIEVPGHRLSLNCEPAGRGHWRIKNGRSLSRKKPFGTTTEVFELGRQWAVKYAANK